MSRRVLLAKLHIAKKDLLLDDGTYRAILLRVTGQESGRDLDDQALDRVLTEMRRLGWKPKASRKRAAHNPQLTKIHALWGRLERAGALEVTGRREALRALKAFCLRRTGVDHPEWLRPEQASNIIEALKSWARRVETKHHE
jgi:phage gp16-like protein